MQLPLRAFFIATLIVASASCSPPKPAEPTRPPTPTPTPTLPPVTAGGTVAMGRPVITPAGSKVTVVSWRIGANRSIAPGPGQVYETIQVSYCAGERVVDESTQDLTPLFALELFNGNRVAADSFTAAGEFRQKGRVKPDRCVAGPIVFQVSGGSKPHFVRFDATPPTKWTVP